MFWMRTGHGAGTEADCLHFKGPGFLGQHLVYTYVIRTLMGFPGPKV